MDKRMRGGCTGPMSDLPVQKLHGRGCYCCRFVGTEENTARKVEATKKAASKIGQLLMLAERRLGRDEAYSLPEATTVSPLMFARSAATSSALY